MKIGLKLKLSIFLAILLFSAVSILSFLVLKGIRSYQKEQYEQYLLQQGETASNYVRQIYLMESIDDPQAFIDETAMELVMRFEMITGMQVILYNMNGLEVANSRPLATDMEVSSLLKYALEDNNAYVEEGDSIIFLSPLHNSTDQIGVLLFQYSIKEDNLFYKNIFRTFLIAGAFIFVLCFVCGNIFIYPITRSILNLKSITTKIELGDFTNMEPLNRTDELGELSQNISFMGNTIKNQIEQLTQEQIQLKDAVEKLELLGEEQKQFIGNVTHEFKTPLTVIRAYTDLMYMYHDDDKLMEDAKNNIENESQRLQDMIDNVLTLASLERYNLDFNMEDLNVGAILSDVCERMKAKVHKFGLQLHTDIDSVLIHADKTRLMQIFINLIDNAIKYNNAEGQIWISCKQVEDYVSITIRDTGIGIPLKARERLFTPFYTVNKSQSGSTGLGLALVKSLVERQGGYIYLKDNHEEGSTFELNFPVI